MDCNCTEVLDRRAKFARKFMAFSKAVNAVAKDSRNPHFKSKYADINAFIAEAKPALEEAGLTILQPITAEFVKTAQPDGKIEVDVVHFINIEIIDTETGYMHSGRMLLDASDKPQQTGSIITYFRRYLLQSLCFLQADDDDAEGSSKTQASRSVPAKGGDGTVKRKTFGGK